MIAMWLMDEYRREHGLHFKFINQVHDAIMLYVPENEVDSTRTMFHETMGNIEIPIPGRPLTLAVDVDVMTRWGEKVEY